MTEGQKLDLVRPQYQGLPVVTSLPISQVWPYLHIHTDTPMHTYACAHVHAQVAVIRGLFKPAEVAPLVEKERKLGGWWTSLEGTDCIAQTTEEYEGSFRKDCSRRTPAFVEGSDLLQLLQKRLQPLATALRCYIVSSALLAGSKKIQMWHYDFNQGELQEWYRTGGKHAWTVLINLSPEVTVRILRTFRLLGIMLSCHPLFMSSGLILSSYPLMLLGRSVAFTSMRAICSTSSSRMHVVSVCSCVTTHTMLALRWKVWVENRN